MQGVRRDDLVYPELSYKIVGCAFDVHNTLGGGHHEKYYQRALAESFKSVGLKFQEQVYFPLIYQDVVVGKGYLDFLVDEKIVVEIKKDNKFSKKNIQQVFDYLKSNHLQLGILINFGNNSVSFKRMVNQNNS